MEIELGFTELEDEDEVVQTSNTYASDWDNGRIIGKIDELYAIAQHIHKSLITMRNQYLIYDSDYGSEIVETLLIPNVTREYIETELPSLIEEAIEDERILQIGEIELIFEGENVFISFDVDTIYGELSIKEAA